MRVCHRSNTIKYCVFLIKTIFISFFLYNLAYSEGTKIGSITELTGEVIAITEDGDERVLDVFDEIFLKDEVLIGESSSATLQFNDNTTIVMKELTSLNVKEDYLKELKETKISHPKIFSMKISVKNIDRLITEWSKPVPFIEVNAELAAREEKEKEQEKMMRAD